MWMSTWVSIQVYVLGEGECVSILVCICNYMACMLGVGESLCVCV